MLCVAEGGGGTGGCGLGSVMTQGWCSPPPPPSLASAHRGGGPWPWVFGGATLALYLGAIGAGLAGTGNLGDYNLQLNDGVRGCPPRPMVLWCIHPPLQMRFGIHGIRGTVGVIH